jgi:hypothetical protein
MRAIIIDPLATPAIYEAEVKGDLEEIQGIIGGYLAPIRIGSSDVLFVDEEWLIKDKSKRFGGAFRIGDHGLGGKGIIFGVKKDDHCSTKLGLLEVSAMVSVSNKPA